MADIATIASRLLDEIRAAEAREIEKAKQEAAERGDPLWQNYMWHQSPGEVARRCQWVIHEAMDQINVGDCGWVIPIRRDDDVAVLTYHPGEGWSIYVDDEIPEWIRDQLDRWLA